MYVIRYKQEREYWSKKQGWSEDIFQADLFSGTQAFHFNKDPLFPVNGEFVELWDINQIQFARLIAESEAAGIYEDSEAVQCMLDSMDLTATELAILTDRAQLAWERWKAKI